MKNKETINMLLNVDNFYGEHEGRLGPIIKFLAATATPVLLWVYMNFPIPGFIFWPVFSVYFLRMLLVILGREKERLANFKNQMTDSFASIFELLRIKTIHPDGCIEYIDGRVGYMLVCYNGTANDKIARSNQVKEFTNLITGGFDLDILVQNITEVKGLEERYKNVKLFVEPEAARDFLDIIDHNRKIVYSSSLLTRTVFVVKGTRSDWKEIHENFETGLHSNCAKAFKFCMIADKPTAEEVFSRDTDTVINFEDLLQRKYSTHEYYGSKVLHFDDAPKEINTGSREESLQGFIPRL